MGDEYNWDDFDSQSAEYLNSPDYQGEQFSTDDGQMWGGQGDPNSQYNFGSAEMPEGGYSDMFGGGLGQMFSMQNGPSMQNSFSIPEGTFSLPQNGEGVGVQPYQGDLEQAMQMPEGAGQGGMNWEKGLSSVSNVLGNLFNQKQGQSGLQGKQLASAIGAYLEGRQNKQMGQGIQQQVQQQQQRSSPYDVASTGASQMGANSMRDAMQQKLAAAMTDPYGQPIVRGQTDALAKAQAIRDAAAGRRSNNATSSPALVAEQAKIAQNYINSLQSPAGAGINPSSQGLDQLIQALKYNTQGYASPAMSALGYNQSTNSNANTMQQLLQALGKA